MAPQLFPITAPLAEPPRVGLLPTLGRTVTEVNQEREVDFTFNPEACGESAVGPGDPCDTSLPSKDIAASPANVEAWSFYVWAGDKCAPNELGRDWQGRARRQLSATLSYQVARELWNGDEAQGQAAPNRYLASEASDVVAGEASPTGVVDAVACLEYALGECVHGTRGMLHVTRQAAVRMMHENLIRRDGNQLLTALDTLVVADAGYDGSGPYGAATDDEQWMYATGMVLVRLGPERVIPDDLSQAVNRTDNTVEYRAERKAAVAWDGCCHLAARVDIGLCAIGGTGS